MMGLTQTKNNPRIASMNDTYRAAMYEARESEEIDELDLCQQSFSNTSLSFLDEYPEGKSRLAIPVINTDRTLST